MKAISKISALVLLTLLALSSCIGAPASPADSARLYYLDEESGKLLGCSGWKKADLPIAPRTPSIPDRFTGNRDKELEILTVSLREHREYINQIKTIYEQKEKDYITHCTKRNGR